MAAPRPPRSLRRLLFGQFGLVMLAACLAAAALMSLWRLPVARQEQQREQLRVAELKLQQLDSALDNVEAVVRALAGVVDERADAGLGLLLERMTHEGALFDTLVLVDPDARIVDIGGVGTAIDVEREWHGMDLSGLAAVRTVLAQRGVHWSEQYLSPMQGRPVVGVVVPTRRGALMAEVSVEHLGRLVMQPGRAAGLLVVVLDRKGEIVAAPDVASARGRSNISHLAPIRALLQGQPGFDDFEYLGEPYHGTALRSDRLGWLVLVAYPSAVANAQRDSAILITTVTLLVSVGVGLLALHRFSQRLARRLGGSIAYARDVADGRYGSRLAPSGIAELEGLNRDLQRMAGSIRQREQQLRAIIDTAPTLAIQLFDRDGRVVDWNPASESMFGWSRQEALGKTLGELLYTPAQHQDFLALLAKVGAEGRPHGPFESEIRQRGGARRVLFSTIFAIQGPQDEPLFASMAVDITTMKAQQDELRANKEKFVTFFDANPVALAVVKQHGDHFEYLDVNRAWVELVGSSREQLLHGVFGPQSGRSFFAEPAERQRFLEQLACAQAFDGFEFRLRRFDGHVRLVAMSLAKVMLDGEEVLVNSAHDVTEKRELEQQLRELNTELETRIAQRTSSLAAANEDLRRTLQELQQAQERLIQSEKLASLGSLVAGVAHELNTPIGNGLMAVSTLQMRQQELRRQLERGLRRSELDAFLAVVDEGCEIAVRNIGRASRLLRSFKQVAVDQSGEQRRRLELAALVDEILLTLSPSLRNKAIEVANEVPAGLCMDSFPGALGQVLTNLIQNAVVHGLEGREHGRLHIRAHAAEAAQVVIEVADDGRGIAEEALKRVFDPFFTTRLGQGGSGLGLSIVRSLVTGPLGGRIELRSQPGQGTVFTLWLPRHAPAAEPVAGQVS